MTKKPKDFLEKSIEELKENRRQDSTNLLRVQIDLFLNILGEAERIITSKERAESFKSAYYGTEKTLIEAGRELIFSILDNIDDEWERQFVKLLIQIEKNNARKLKRLEEELFRRLEEFSEQMMISRSNANHHLDRLKTEVIERIEETENHRKTLIRSLRELIEQDIDRENSTQEPPASFSLQ